MTKEAVKQNSDLKYIPISQIRENVDALRPAQKDTEGYKELRDSIEVNGVLQSIIVTPRKDDITGEAYFLLVDGCQRFTACKDLGIETIPALIKDLSKEDIYINQITANAAVVDTKPMQYTGAILRYLASENCRDTKASLAKKIGKSIQWLETRLNLQKIKNPKIAALVDSGEIKLANAYSLARLNVEDQEAFANEAMTEDSVKFGNDVVARLKEVRTEQYQGRKAGPKQFIPTPVLRKLTSIKAEMTEPKIGPALVQKHKVKNASDGFALGIKWVLSQDPDSIDEQRERYDAHQAAVKEQKDKLAKERAEKAVKKAAGILESFNQ